MTIEIRMEVMGAQQELLVAELDALGCEGFVQESRHLLAYATETAWRTSVEPGLAPLLKQYDVKPSYTTRGIGAQNWNAQWEATIQAVEVGTFLVRPTWDNTTVRTDLIPIVIDPKMSFGTGYHATTRLMLRSLPKYLKPNARVLDAGTGTGILAIAAVKSGAQSVIAFDIDEWSIDNAPENFALNEVTAAISIRQGGIETVPESAFDLILANINRIALQEMLPAFVKRIHSQGRILLAGLLLTDRQSMLNLANVCGLSPVEESEEDEWWSVVLQRAEEKQ